MWKTPKTIEFSMKNAIVRITRINLGGKRWIKKILSHYLQKMLNWNKTEAEKLVAAFLNTVEETLVAGDGVAFMGFGKFETSVREARTCVNPRTKEKWMYLLKSGKI